MNKFVILIALILPAISHAGDNGSYESCRSASGRTRLVFGNVGSALNEETAELVIDKKSIGSLEVNNSVVKHYEDENVVHYIEADKEAEILLSLEFLKVSPAEAKKKISKKVLIFGGLDPRTLKKLEKNIVVTCHTVYNPI